ncbi:hypothetical protein IMSHALPRED_005181 [Imshaugia aleurites]|uniref:Heterokaryon incompatibility domain-containing protein n=1 Tax=Imshaugia aleurites TaxID=172621 RepID=A0A8H3IHW4_9LECA|nr:hypothetical protein IMSHALPRED_005181 [Imshaugia aleurites]
MALYSYRPLTGKSEIRLLHLLSGIDNESLCGTLVHVDLDAHPSYRTLSYTWGEPDFTCHINLDGRELAITSGLDSALRRLRSSDDVVEIWADAICVNQKNTAERNLQVLLMKRLYSKCEECMIYMGTEGDNSDIVPGFLRELHNGYVGLYNNDGMRPGDHVLPSSIPAPDHPGWLAFQLFMARPWFRRVWVIQEFALPRVVTMLCGKWTMDATTPGVIMCLFNIFGIAFVTHDLHDPVMNGLAHRGMMLVESHLWLRLYCGNKSGLMSQVWNGALASNTSITSPTDRSLLSLLKVAKFTHSSDPRDRFYGVFGLSTDLEDSGLEVDYTKGFEEIELEISKYLVRQGGGLEILKDVSSSVSTSDILPSWLAGWTNNQVVSFRCGKRRRIDIPHRNTDSNLHPIRFKDASNILSVNGYFLDIIEELGMERTSYSLTGIAAVLRQIETMVADSLFLGADHNLPDSLWRTIIGDKGHKKSPAPPEYATKYRTFRDILFDDWDFPQDPYSCKEGFNDLQDFRLSWNRTHDARFSITRSGMMAMAPRYARIGDAIITVRGDPDYQTFVVRRKADSDCYIWIGKAYVHCPSGDEYCAIEKGEPREIMIC